MSKGIGSQAFSPFFINSNSEAVVILRRLQCPSLPASLGSLTSLSVCSTHTNNPLLSCRCLQCPVLLNDSFSSWFISNSREICFLVLQVPVLPMLLSGSESFSPLFINSNPKDSCFLVLNMLAAPYPSSMSLLSPLSSSSTATASIVDPLSCRCQQISDLVHASELQCPGCMDALKTKD